MIQTKDIDRHEDFWLEDGDLILLVDDVYFKVHRAILSRSCGLIKDLVALPINSSSQSEGCSIEHPVPIHEVAFDDFRIILRDAYGRQPVIDFETDTASITRLVRAAHRLQSWRLLVTAATDAMGMLSAADRLSLCRDLDLDSVRTTQEVASAKEITLCQAALDKRNTARALPERKLKSRGSLEPNAWFMAAFFEAASSPNVTLPVSGLDDKLNLQLVLARSALRRERRQRVERFFHDRQQYHFGTIDASAAVAELDVRSETFDAWYSKQAEKGYGPASVEISDLRTVFPTEAEDRAIVRQFWSQS